MKILLAEDDVLERKSLSGFIAGWGHEVLAVDNGHDAWDILSSSDSPSIAVLDRMMPGISGNELCCRVREMDDDRGIYLILLTALDSDSDIVEGLSSGADDYITKPFNPEELRVRIGIGCRIVDLQSRLSKRIVELQAAIDNVRHLEGLLPICAYCKKIRDGDNYWHQVELYIHKRANVQFSHSCCPECYDKLMAEVDAIED